MHSLDNMIDNVPGGKISKVFSLTMKKTLTIAFLLLLIVGSAFAWTGLDVNLSKGLKTSTTNWIVYDLNNFEKEDIGNQFGGARKVIYRCNYMRCSNDENLSIDITLHDIEKAITIDWGKLNNPNLEGGDIKLIVAFHWIPEDWVEYEGEEPLWFEAREPSPVPTEDSEARVLSYTSGKGYVEVNSYDYEILKSMYLDGRNIRFAILFENGYCLSLEAFSSSMLKYFLAD